MINYKNRHRIWIKTISMIVVCLFTLNSISWALSPESRMSRAEFREMFQTGYALLSHMTANSYISSKIPSEGLDGLKTRKDHVTVRTKEGTIEQPIIIVSIPGLLKSTGQFAHVGLGRVNGMPALYADSKHYYDHDVLQHEKDEISQYESKRIEFGFNYSQMRGWLKTDEGKTFAKEAHRDSHSIDHLISVHKEAADIDSVYAAYLEHGLDEEDEDVNIAASKKKDNWKKVQEKLKANKEAKLKREAEEDKAKAQQVKSEKSDRGHLLLKSAIAVLIFGIAATLIALLWDFRKNDGIPKDNIKVENPSGGASEDSEITYVDYDYKGADDSDMPAGRKVFMIGHRHLAADTHFKLMNLIFNQKGLYQGKDSAESKRVREELKKLEKEYLPQIAIYRENIEKIKELISDPNNNIAVLSGEFAEEELYKDKLNSGADQERLRQLVEILRKRGIEDPEKLADDICLLLNAPVRYLMIMKDPILEKVRIVPADVLEYKMKHLNNIYKASGVLEKLVLVSKRAGINTHHVTVLSDLLDGMGEGIKPGQQTIERALEPFNRNREAFAIAKEAVAFSVDGDKYRRLRDVNILKTIDSRTENMLIILGGLHTRAIERTIKRKKMKGVEFEFFGRTIDKEGSSAAPGLRHFKAFELEPVEREYISVRGERERRDRKSFTDKDAWGKRADVRKSKKKRRFTRNGEYNFLMEAGEARELADALCMTQKELETLLHDAFVRYKEHAGSAGDSIREKEIVISLIDRKGSEYLFEDCTNNSFIGINRELFNIAKKDKKLAQILLAVGIFHELRHEGKDESADEDFRAEASVMAKLMISENIKEVNLHVISEAFFRSDNDAFSHLISAVYEAMDGSLQIAEYKGEKRALAERTEIGSNVMNLDLGGGVRADVPVYAQGPPVPSTILDNAISAEQAQITTTFDQSVSAAERIKKRMSELSAGKEQSRRELMVRSSEIQKAHQLGSLEQARIALGHDKNREKLLEIIHDHISFTEGFAMYKKSVKELYGKDVNTMEDLNRILPHLTTYEVALCSALESVPKAMLVSPTELKPPSLEDRQANDLIPMIYDIDIDGISIAIGGIDDLRPRDTGEHYDDQYEYLGITGVSTMSEFIRFKPEFAKSFRALILLVVDDSDIYKRVWEESGGSGGEMVSEKVMVGHGKLRREVLRKLRTFDKENEIVKNTIREVERLGITEEDLEKPLNDLVKEKYLPLDFLRNLDELLAMRLANKQFVDLTTGVMLTDSLYQLFVLMGILENVPDVLMGKEPFSGYVVGFGKGVKILDSAGNVAGYFPFSPHMQFEAQVNLHEEVTDTKSTNATAMAMFSAIENKIAERLFDDDKAPSSAIDKVAENMLWNYRVLLETRVKRQMIINPGWGGRIAYHTVKMGLDEAAEIAAIMNKLGRSKLANIRKIRKEVATVYKIDDIISGEAKMASYSPKEKAVIIYHYVERPFALMSSEERQAYRHTIVHEIGHSVWESLPEEAKEKYTRISWDKNLTIKKKDLTKHFMTRYSHKSLSPAEDFAEHFAMYVNHGPEFRELTKFEPLRQKYDILKDIFTSIGEGGEKKTVEYSDDPGMTMAQLEGALDTLTAKADFKDAYEQMNRSFEEDYKIVENKIANRVHAIDEYAGVEDTDEEGDEEEWDDDLSEYDEYAYLDDENGERHQKNAEEEALEVTRQALAILDASPMDVDDSYIRFLLNAYRKNDKDAIEQILRRVFDLEGDAEEFIDIMKNMGDLNVGRENDSYKRGALSFETASAQNVIKIIFTGLRHFEIHIGDEWDPVAENELTWEVGRMQMNLQKAGINVVDIRIKGIPSDSFEKLFESVNNITERSSQDLYAGTLVALGGGVCAVRKGDTLVVDDLSEQLRPGISGSAKKPKLIVDPKSKRKGSPAELLGTIRDDDALLGKALSEEGITAAEMAEIRPFSRSTVNLEFKILKDLGILVPAAEPHHYRFSDMIKGPNESYTKTLINAIADIHYQVGKKGDERPLHRSNIPKEARPIVKEVVKMTVISQANILRFPVLPEKKVLWHILEGGILSVSQQHSFRQKINSSSIKSDSPERVYITRDGETIEDAVSMIKTACPNAVFDVALSNASHIDSVPRIDGKDIKMLVFEGSVGDFTQVEGVIAVLRALHLSDEEVIPALLRLYNILTGSPYKGDAPDMSLLNDPREFARRFVMVLPPATSLPINDIPKINNMLLEVIIAA